MDVMTNQTPALSPLTSDLARKRGRQKGYLRQEGPSWIGYWWEEIRLPSRALDWRRASRAICATSRTNESGRTIKITKHEAQRIFQETILDRLEVRSLNPQSIATLKEFVEQKYRPTIILKRRKTQEHLRNMLDNHILPELGGKQLRDFRPDDIENLVLRKFGAGKSSQTVWHIRKTLAAIFKRDKRIGWYQGELPTDGIEMPALKHRERIALTRDQTIDLLERLPIIDRAMVLVLALTGLRIGELCGLRWFRVNLTEVPATMEGEVLAPLSIAVRESFIRVSGKSLGEDQRGGQYQDVKTTKSRRNIPLVALATQILRDLKTSGKFTGPKDPVFAAGNGKPIDAHNELARKLKPALIELGIPRVSWHDLRHRSATFADQAWLTATERQRILGHSAASMTDHYTHAEMERVRAPMETMSKGFEAVMQRPTR
jgi:integrase